MENNFTQNNNSTAIEVMKGLPFGYKGIKAALFDFDGTISTLRQGWEDVMEPLMVEMICGNTRQTREIVEEVRQYINESTGIQTIHQMKWLSEAVEKYGKNPAVHDEWWYKDEYNKRLIERVKARVQDISNGRLIPEDFIIKGAREFLEVLSGKGIELYVASGTDHEDVISEVKVLGLSGYFKEVAGAPNRKVNCSKEKVLNDLIKEKGFKGSELLVVGDGKVEIALGNRVGAVTLGMATDEVKRYGVNDVKRIRLVGAGCHAFIGDFTNYNAILEWLYLK